MEEGASEVFSLPEVCWVLEACCCRAAWLSPGTFLGKTVGLRVLLTAARCRSPARGIRLWSDPWWKSRAGKETPSSWTVSPSSSLYWWGLILCQLTEKKKTLKRAHIPFCWAGNPLVTGTDQELKAIWVSPGKQVKNHHYKAKGFAGISAWVGKIPWGRKWQITPVFLPGKSHGFWRAIAHGLQKSDTTEWLNHHHKAKRWRGTNLFAMWRMKIKVNIN